MISRDIGKQRIKLGKPHQHSKKKNETLKHKHTALPQPLASDLSISLECKRTFPPSFVYFLNLFIYHTIVIINYLDARVNKRCLRTSSITKELKGI